MPKSTSNNTTTRKRKAQKSDDAQRDRLTNELTSGIALTAAYKRIPPLKTNLEDEHDNEILGRLTLDIGVEYFNLAKADRWLTALRAAIQTGAAIPQPAKDSLLSMVGQIEHEFFAPYLNASMIVGVAAGLKGYGSQYVKAPTGGAR